MCSRAARGAYWALGTIGNTPWTFIVTAGLVYFTWGEIYSLFPAICTDTYGVQVRDDECGTALHGQGHGLVPRAGRELAAGLDRQLARRVHRRRGRQHRGRGHGAARRQADARLGDSARRGRPCRCDHPATK